MAIFTIGDLHLSLGSAKPMDIFPGWEGYLDKIKSNWLKLIKPEDTVVLVGDISWAIRLEDAKQDFAFLHELPGKKILLKGNHDYWWTTAKKMNQFFQDNGLDSLQILHNNTFEVEGVCICGSRSWMFDVNEPHDEKVMNRELGRLKASLDAAGDKEKLVFLHYPPVYPNANAQEVISLLQQYNVKHCFYGHLHGPALRYAVQGDVDGIEYKLISADGVAFCPYKIS